MKIFFISYENLILLFMKTRGTPTIDIQKVKEIFCESSFRFIFVFGESTFFSFGIDNLILFLQWLLDGIKQLATFWQVAVTFAKWFAVASHQPQNIEVWTTRQTYLLQMSGKQPSLFKSENYYILGIQEIHIETESFIRKEQHQVKFIYVRNSLVN